MLIGEHRHTLDSKKRVALPAGFRRAIGKQVVITRGLDVCLFVYPATTWRKMAEKISVLPLGQADSRRISRFLLAGAVETEVDSLGRVLIPDYLKDFAGLKIRVVIAGMNDRLEIWDERRWRQETERIEKQADVVAEKLGQVGVL